MQCRRTRRRARAEPRRPLHAQGSAGARKDRGDAVDRWRGAHIAARGGRRRLPGCTLRPPAPWRSRPGENAEKRRLAHARRNAGASRTAVAWWTDGAVRT